MPKGKRSSKFSYPSARKYSGQQSDDDSVNDNASIYSGISEHKSGEEEENQDIDIQDQFEEKLLEYIDNMNQKSSQGRVNCFKSVSKAFVSKFMPLFVTERHFTLCDSIERSLKKGGTDERSAAADLACIVCVQLGSDTLSQDICQSLKSILITTAMNNSVDPVARAKCCNALAILYFLVEAELGDILDLMQTFESIFSQSYLKGDGSIPNLSTEIGNLHAAALSAWGLLVTMIEPSNVVLMVTETKTLPSIKQLSELLESQHLEVRLNAGEVLAVLFEIGHNDDDFIDEFDVIVDSLKNLATDSHKYRAKKDRKQQRATFRDVLVFIEEDIIPDVQVKFGKEVLILDSWCKRKQYDMLCSVLGPGINIHMAENQLLRDIFDLEEPIVHDMPSFAKLQSNRNHKRLVNAANFKARTISRAKNRDKRSDF